MNVKLWMHEQKALRRGRKKKSRYVHCSPLLGLIEINKTIRTGIARQQFQTRIFVDEVPHPCSPRQNSAAAATANECGHPAIPDQSVTVIYWGKKKHNAQWPNVVTAEAVHAPPPIEDGAADQGARAVKQHLLESEEKAKACGINIADCTSEQRQRCVSPSRCRRRMRRGAANQAACLWQSNKRLKTST